MLFLCSTVTLLYSWRKTNEAFVLLFTPLLSPPTYFSSYPIRSIFPVYISKLHASSLRIL